MMPVPDQLAHTRKRARRVMGVMTFYFLSDSDIGTVEDFCA